MLACARDGGRSVGWKMLCGEVREGGAAQVRKDLGTTVRNLDFIAVAAGSHWKASHLSLHHLGDITLLFQKKKEWAGRNHERKHVRLC